MTWRWGWILYTWNTLPSGTETTTKLARGWNKLLCKL